jgi:hypothetical protein
VLLKPSVSKVVVLAHGTGAALLAQTLDALFVDLGAELMGKIEIYTFGSAAKYMSNPCSVVEKRKSDSARGVPTNGAMDCPPNVDRIEKRRRAIPVCSSGSSPLIITTSQRINLRISTLNITPFQPISSQLQEFCTTPSKSSIIITADVSSF